MDTWFIHTNCFVTWKPSIHSVMRESVVERGVNGLQPGDIILRAQESSAERRVTRAQIGDGGVEESGARL